MRGLLDQGQLVHQLNPLLHLVGFFLFRGVRISIRSGIPNLIVTHEARLHRLFGFLADRHQHCLATSVRNLIHHALFILLFVFAWLLALGRRPPNTFSSPIEDHAHLVVSLQVLLDVLLAHFGDRVRSVLVEGGFDAIGGLALRRLLAASLGQRLGAGTSSPPYAHHVLAICTYVSCSEAISCRLEPSASPLGALSAFLVSLLLLLKIGYIFEFLEELVHCSVECNVLIWMNNPPLRQLVRNTRFEGHRLEGLRVQVRLRPHLKLARRHLIFNNPLRSNLKMFLIALSKEIHLYLDRLLLVIAVVIHF